MINRRSTTPRLLALLCIIAATSQCSDSDDTTPPLHGTPTDSILVSRLDFARYKANILGISQFGDRTQGTQRNLDALTWIQTELQSYGYTNVTRDPYTYLGQPRENIYVTKVGSTVPQEMYIVSAHMDGRGAGQASDDDGSGCALLLELARVLASADVQSDRSIRIIFWNNEETGLNGSAAYANSHAALQGIESPAGSHVYPEPRWLGVIQHDMLLFDHGLPPGASQSATADVDVEYQASSTKASDAAALAAAFLTSSQRHSSNYPAQLGNNMDNTDSKSFQNVVASISVRENQRVAEIGNGANPNWHQATDLYTTYSDADFRLGFNAAQMTLGAVTVLATARIVP